MEPLAEDHLLTALRLGVIVAGGISIGFIWRIAGSDGDWSDEIRSRFLYGVPWGSAIVVGFVLSVYLFVQGGFDHWDDPLMVPFTATSLFYPLGWLFAAFSHSSPSHLMNNLTSTLVFAPIAEYVWGHYPRTERSKTGPVLLANPYLRAFVVFPGVVILVGLITALFAWGPVIGFSGVVYALVGFSLVKYPLFTVIALLIRSGLRVILNSLRTPILVSEVTTTLSRPSWADVAVQAHALGLLIGVLLGVVLLRHRNDRTDPLRIWLGSVLAGLSMGIWAIWWVRGPSTYVLYRALGVLVVIGFATLIVAAIAVSDRPLLGTVSRRRTAMAVLFVPVVTMSLVAIPLNLTVVEGTSHEPRIEVADYTIFYGEEIDDEMMGVVDVAIGGESTQVTTSGVIVVSEERHVWRRMVSQDELAFWGERNVVVGGIGWREVVTAERLGWEPVDNETVYQVWLSHEDERVLAFSSEPKRVDPIVDGNEISIAAEDGAFHLIVSNNETTDQVPLPDENSSVQAQGITFDHTNESIYATWDDSKVKIASRETYGPE